MTTGLNYYPDDMSNLPNPSLDPELFDEYNQLLRPPEPEYEAEDDL
jgi:hypothetical protein